MSPSLRLVFEDGTEREIAGLPWQTVFQAAQAHGIELATDCREGACGTCKARCTEGEYDVGDASPEALTAEEEAAGLVLTCQMLPLGDCTLRFPYPFSLTGGPLRRQAVLEPWSAWPRHGPVRVCARCGAAVCPASMRASACPVRGRNGPSLSPAGTGPSSMRACCRTA